MLPEVRASGQGSRRVGVGEDGRGRERARCADAWLHSLGGYIRPDVELRGSIGARRSRRKDASGQRIREVEGWERGRESAGRRDF